MCVYIYIDICEIYLYIYAHSCYYVDIYNHVPICSCCTGIDMDMGGDVGLFQSFGSCKAGAGMSEIFKTGYRL